MNIVGATNCTEDLSTSICLSFLLIFTSSSAARFEQMLPIISPQKSPSILTETLQKMPKPPPPFAVLLR
jgi:hypothetical protein